jgi:protein-S-isoprenylcysteine O-methyltransferase Ste14
MLSNANQGFKRWLEYMQFKSSSEAFLKFHLPLVLLFVSVISCSLIGIAFSKKDLLASFVLSICLWLIGLSLLRLGFMGNRDKYLKRFGRLAYKIAAYKFMLPYGALWLSCVTMPLWIPGERVLKVVPFSLFGIFFIAVALFLLAKTKAASGIDRLIFVYSYYPDDAALVKSKIYEFIRHPAYAAWIYFGIGFFLIRGSLNSLVILGMNFLAISLLAWMEEADIIHDSKEDYRLYKNNVPSFLPKRPFAFFSFLLQMRP